MYSGRNALGSVVINDIYFIIMIIIGGFFLLEFIITILYLNINEQLA